MADSPVSPPRPPCHVGIVTNDLESAMAALTQTLGSRWGSPSAVDGDYVTASGRQRLRLRVVHSAGPIAIELLEGEHGSVWECDELTRLHHYAFWSSDLEGEIEALRAKSYEVELTSVPGPGGGGFAYLVRPGSARLELIQRAATS